MGLTSILAFLGGIGLFLLGMRLMTDGLKVAAGDTLHAILASATRSRLRGLASGVLITAIVQSSSAVVFATIGFVNAGLLSLHQAIGIIFGANLGTTFTSWIVALLGFNVDLQAMAMPAIGIGMALWVSLGARRYGAIGQALAGFGLFFLGIDVLKEAFAGLGDSIALENMTDYGPLNLVLFVAVGVLLTVLMQSSSAALAVTLTAAAGGVIPLTAAAAMVIGANVGTTSTAAFAVIGATAAAKRAASAHVMFSLVTGFASLLLLPILLWLVGGLAKQLGFPEQVAVMLAIFHTLTKLTGILLMLPLTGLLVKFLENRFRSAEEDEAQPRFLDRNVQSTPSLAMDALVLELQRMTEFAHRLAAAAISAEQMDVERLRLSVRALEELNLHISEFTSGIARQGGSSELTTALPNALRVGNYLVNVGENAMEMARLQMGLEITDPAIADSREQLWAHAADLIAHCQLELKARDSAVLQKKRSAFEDDYQNLKHQLLRAGTDGSLSPRRMFKLLEQMSALHRIVDQTTKAALYLDRYREQLAHTEHSRQSSEPQAEMEGSGTKSETDQVHAQDR